MNPVLKCLNCGRVYEDVGDDYWCECPYCQSLKCRDAVEGKDYILKGNK